MNTIEFTRKLETLREAQDTLEDAATQLQRAGLDDLAEYATQLMLHIAREKQRLAGGGSRGGADEVLALTEGRRS